MSGYTFFIPFIVTAVLILIVWLFTKYTAPKTDASSKPPFIFKDFALSFLCVLVCILLSLVVHYVVYVLLGLLLVWFGMTADIPWVVYVGCSAVSASVCAVLSGLVYKRMMRNRPERYQETTHKWLKLLLACLLFALTGSKGVIPMLIVGGCAWRVLSFFRPEDM